MRVTSIAAVMIAVFGLGLATRFKVYENFTCANAAAPVSFARNNGWAVGAAISNKPSFSPLRNDICDDGISNSLSSMGIELQQIQSAGTNAKCGEHQTRDRVDTDE